MEKRLEKLSETLTEAEAELIADDLAEFEGSAHISADAQQRILSSVMRKAGHRMNETIKMTGTERDIRMANNKTHTAEVRKRFGGIAAAAAAFAVAAGGIFAAVSSGKNTIKPASEMPSSRLEAFTGGGSSSEPAEDTGSDTAVRDWAKPYLEENPDTIGYLSLGRYAYSLGELDELSFPVVQNRGDAWYYEDKGFDGQPSGSGTPYLDCNAAIREDGRSQNLIIRATDVAWSNGEDEVDLIYSELNDEYVKDDDHYFNSGIIRFKSIYDEDYSEYQIISLFTVDPGNEEEKGYNSLELWYTGFDDEHTFEDWREMQRYYGEEKRYIFFEDIPCTENDEYITLTVGYSDTIVPPGTQPSRGTIIAKKITPGDKKQEITDSTGSVTEDASSAEDTSSVEEVSSAVTNSEDEQISTADKVQVPDVMGLTASQAIEILRDAGLSYYVEEVKYEGKKGKVVEQSVKAGEYVGRDTQITIFISTGETDPITMTIQIPVPEGLKGMYVIDVYRDGTLAYTKTIENAETVAGDTVSLDICGKKTEDLVIYFRPFDSEDYVSCLRYRIDYDKETAEICEDTDTDDILPVTPR